jgi:hypothetical protein
MRAAVLLDLDDIAFVEPSFARLTDDSYTDQMLIMQATAARLLINKAEWPIGLALSSGNEWKACAFVARKPTMDIIEKVEALEGDILQEEQEEWEAAVREYFSLDLVRNVPPALEDLNPKRVGQVKDLIAEHWGVLSGVCLDVGCGTGAGSQALREAGLTPLSYDNDPALLARGLVSGRLQPEQTACFDGAMAHRYLRPVPYAIVLMAGEIHPHNQIIWKMIVDEAIGLAGKTLVTVGTEREGRIVKQWADEKGGRCELHDNDADPFYDAWVCSITRR